MFSIEAPSASLSESSCFRDAEFLNGAVSVEKQAELFQTGDSGALEV